MEFCGFGSARRPNPGRGSTYRRRNSVQTPQKDSDPAFARNRSAETIRLMQSKIAIIADATALPWGGSEELWSQAAKRLVS